MLDIEKSVNEILTTVMTIITTFTNQQQQQPNYREESNNCSIPSTGTSSGVNPKKNNCTEQSWFVSFTIKDTILYALSIGYGNDNSNNNTSTARSNNHAQATATTTTTLCSIKNYSSNANDDNDDNDELRYLYENHPEYTIVPTFCLSIPFYAVPQSSDTTGSFSNTYHFLPTFPPQLMKSVGLLPTEYIKLLQEQHQDNNDDDLDQYPVLHVHQSIAHNTSYNNTKNNNNRCRCRGNTLTTTTARLTVDQETEHHENEDELLFQNLYSTRRRQRNTSSSIRLRVTSTIVSVVPKSTLGVFVTTETNIFYDTTNKNDESSSSSSSSSKDYGDDDNNNPLPKTTTTETTLLCTLQSTVLILGLQLPIIPIPIQNKYSPKKSIRTNRPTDGKVHVLVLDELYYIHSTTALLYRLASGDTNKIHVSGITGENKSEEDDEDGNKLDVNENRNVRNNNILSSSEPALLHGSCTLGIVSRYILRYCRRHSCYYDGKDNNNKNKVVYIEDSRPFTKRKVVIMEYIEATFTKPVYMKDTIRIKLWRQQQSDTTNEDIDDDDDDASGVNTTSIQLYFVVYKVIKQDPFTGTAVVAHGNDDDIEKHYSTKHSKTDSSSTPTTTFDDDDKNSVIVIKDGYCLVKVKYHSTNCNSTSKYDDTTVSRL